MSTFCRRRRGLRSSEASDESEGRHGAYDTASDRPTMERRARGARTRKPVSLRALRALRSMSRRRRSCAALATPRRHDLERTQVLITFARDGSFVARRRQRSELAEAAARVVSRQLRRPRRALGGRPRGPADVGRVHPPARRRGRPSPPARPHAARRAHAALVLRPGDRSVSADDPPRRRPRDGRGSAAATRGAATIDLSRPVPAAPIDQRRRRRSRWRRCCSMPLRFGSRRATKDTKDREQNPDYVPDVVSSVVTVLIQRCVEPSAAGTNFCSRWP